MVSTQLIAIITQMFQLISGNKNVFLVQYVVYEKVITHVHISSMTFPIVIKNVKIILICALIKNWCGLYVADPWCRFQWEWRSLWLHTLMAPSCFTPHILLEGLYMQMRWTFQGEGWQAEGTAQLHSRKQRRMGHRRRLEMGGEGSPVLHPAVRALPCGQREMAQFFRQKMTQSEIVF